MNVEKMIAIAQGHLVPAMDAAGKHLEAEGAVPHEAMIALATQLICQGKFILRLVGGDNLVAQILYRHADDAAGKVKP